MDKVDILSKLIDAQREGRTRVAARESVAKKEQLKQAPSRSNIVYNTESGQTFLGNYKNPIKKRVVNISKLNPYI